MKLYLDVESSGLKGPLLLVQYSIDRGPINIIEDPYRSGEKEMLELFEHLMSPETILTAYNAGFDLGKLYQYYLPKYAFNCQVIDLWVKVLKLEPLCHYPFIGGKPMLVLKKIHLDSADKIEESVKADLKQFLPPFLGKVDCSRRDPKDSIPKIKGEEKEGSKNKEFVNLEFKPKFDAKLKSLVPLFAPQMIKSALQFDEVLYLPKHVRINKDKEIIFVNHESTAGAAWKEDQRVPYPLPGEYKYYRALHRANMRVLSGEEGEEKRKDALTYARKDIEYLHLLEDFLLTKNSPEKLEPNYNDTVTHIVAFTRYYGVEVDIEKAKIDNEELEKEKGEIEKKIGINLRSFPQRKALLKSCLIPIYQEPVGDNLVSTAIPILEQLLIDDLISPGKEEVISGLIKYGSICQVLKQYETILLGNGRFYPDFRVLGTITDRMAGTSGFNCQGVSKDAKIRSVIKTTCSGDFDALEVIIAAHLYQDENLLREIRNGEDPHTNTVSRIFEQFRGRKLTELMKIKGDKSHPEYADFSKCRNDSKGIFFGVLYGSEPMKQGEQLRTTPEKAEKIMEEHFFAHYPSLKKSREDLQRAYCTADFDTWRKDSIDKMKRYTENLYGDRRWIDFEVNVASWFWKNADKYANLIPRSEKRRVIRMQAKGPQEIRQTVRSACLGATSKIQKSVSRQLGNYPIQSTGARLTKELMCEIWRFYKVPMFNVHDEVNLGHHELIDTPGISRRVQDFVEKKRELIPHLSMDFGPAKTWADK